MDRAATAGIVSVGQRRVFYCATATASSVPISLKQVKELGIQEVLGTPRAPQQRAYIERVIGTIHRECLDRLIIVNEAALHRHLKLILEYYHGTRTHLSMEKDTPESPSVQPPESGRVVAVPQVGGLHHRYERRAA
jgi:hypothetical protein